MKYRENKSFIPLPFPRSMEALEGPSFLVLISALKCGYESIVLLRPSYRKTNHIIRGKIILVKP